MYAIWNLTRKCPWHCDICCVSRITDKSDKSREKELTFEEKLRVLKRLEEANLDHIDFSGGDPLFYQEDFKIIEEATKMFPKDMISVSTTGYDFNLEKINLLKKVGKAEFTLDYFDSSLDKSRQKGYNNSSMNAIELCVKNGIDVSAVTVLNNLTVDINQDFNNLNRIFQWLCETKVPEWDILLFLPVGVAQFNYSKYLLSKKEILLVVDYLKSLKGFTKIVFQHSFDVMMGCLNCRAGVETFGILPDGTVSACAWALDYNCQPYDGFKLGKVPEQSLEDILTSTSKSWNGCKNCRTIKYLKEFALKGVNIYDD